MRSSFPRGALYPSEKFSRPLRASDRGRAFAPEARRGGDVRGGYPWECGGGACCEALRLGATGTSGGGAVRWLAAVGFAGRRGARLDAASCAVAMSMRCTGCLVPSWCARWDVWGLQCPLWHCVWWRVEKAGAHRIDFLNKKVAHAAVLGPSGSGQDVLQA